MTSPALPVLPNAAPIDDPRAPIYFMHIPKTAGTTFSEFLESHFTAGQVCPAHLWRQLVALPPDEVAACTLVWGHFYAYYWRYVPAPARYVIFLRDPVERALSHYGHIVRDEAHYLHARAHALGSFGAFLRDPQTSTTVRDFQVRSMALDLDPMALAVGLTSAELAQGVLEQRLETAPFDQPAERLLAVAEARLAQMSFVGITERYDESIDLFCRRFGWPHPGPRVLANVNEGRPKRQQIEAADLALLQQMNRCDDALYRAACRRFEADLAPPKTSFFSRLAWRHRR